MRVQWGVIIQPVQARPPTVSATQWRKLSYEAVSVWRGALFSDNFDIWQDHSPWIDERGAPLRKLALDLIMWRRDFDNSLMAQSSPYSIVELSAFELIWVVYLTSEQVKIIKIDVLADATDLDTAISCTLTDPSAVTWGEPSTVAWDE